MAEETNISWCDMTHNHWIGCTRVSPACDGCYAAHLMDTRLGRVEWGEPGKGAGTRSLTSEANRRKPLTWNRKAAAAGTRPFVFCSSLADVFDNQVPVEWRVDLFRLIRATPNLVWLLLTKRPQLITKLYDEACREDVQWLGEAWPENAAIGTTIEDQKRAEVNETALVNAAAELSPMFTFVSCEPLLEGIRLRHLYPTEEQPRIDWVITGGETDQGGHKARPSHPDWYRALRDQCAAAGVPFHMKQWGEYASADDLASELLEDFELRDMISLVDRQDNSEQFHAMAKVGKHRSGRLLDGVLHDARPEVAA